MGKTGGCLSGISQRLFGRDNGIPLVAPSQVHGTRMIEALPSRSLPARPEGDALLVRRPGVFGSLRFADCIPVVGISVRPRPWVLLVHSGFVGTS
ncbi:MAG TPA: laccase domain-containing protein, partial [Synergistales bacterium]|nr:laccase domain-containing protein [Synergistales bacterium]